MATTFSRNSFHFLWKMFVESLWCLFLVWEIGDNCNEVDSTEIPWIISCVCFIITGVVSIQFQSFVIYPPTFEGEIEKKYFNLDKRRWLIRVKKCDLTFFSFHFFFGEIFRSTTAINKIIIWDKNDRETFSIEDETQTTNRGMSKDASSFLLSKLSRFVLLRHVLTK